MRLRKEGFGERQDEKSSSWPRLFQISFPSVFPGNAARDRQPQAYPLRILCFHEWLEESFTDRIGYSRAAVDTRTWT